MNKIIRLIVFLIIILSTISISIPIPSVNICLLTGTLLEDPVIVLNSMSRVDNNGKIITNSEDEVSDFKLKIWITRSNLAGRADIGCQLPDLQPFELAISLTNPGKIATEKLTDAKQGDQIELLHTIEENGFWRTKDEYSLGYLSSCKTCYLK